MRTRADVLAYRIHAQQLDRAPSPRRAVTSAAIFDFGVQDTSRDGASWALANRGVPVASAEALESSDAVALAWTLRGSPHYYRRDGAVRRVRGDLADVGGGRRQAGRSTPTSC